MLPGLLLAVAIAVAARLLSGALPAVVSEILVAVLLGIVVANALPLPAAVTPGARALGGGRAAVALALGGALRAGPPSGAPPRLRLLIGVGTAVCGNSAIV